MPAQTEKTGILANLGNRLVKAYSEAVTTPVHLNLAGNQLPPGINNGIAHLRDLKFDVYKSGDKFKDKPCWVAEACAISPKDHSYRNSVGQIVNEPVQGTLFWLREPLFDTPDRSGDRSRKTFEEHFKFVIDYLITFGWEPPKDFGSMNSGAVEQCLRNAMAALVKTTKHPDTPICFRFRTWIGKRTTLAKDELGKWWLWEVDENGRPTRKVSDRGPYSYENEARTMNRGAGQDPQTQVVWMAVIPGYKIESEGEVDDQSGDGSAAYAPSVSTNGASSHHADEETTFAATEEGFDEFGDLDSLAQRADSQDDETAKDTLTDLAVKAGYNEDEIKDAESWSEVAEMIRNPRTKNSDTAPEETDSEEAAEERVPKKGEVVNYRPIAVKTGKPVKNAVECEIKSVAPTKKTVTLLLLKDRKTEYKDVPWSDLE